MDPEVTIRDMLGHIRERNVEEARQCFEELMDWINKGGFIYLHDDNEAVDEVTMHPKSLPLPEAMQKTAQAIIATSCNLPNNLFVIPNGPAVVMPRPAGPEVDPAMVKFELTSIDVIPKESLVDPYCTIRSIEPKEERIKCAAIQAWGGKIWEGKRHAYIFVDMIKAGTDRLLTKMYSQGFVTNTGRFVNRYEAADIALKAGQVTTGEIINNSCGLTSEELNDE